MCIGLSACGQCSAVDRRPVAHPPRRASTGRSQSDEPARALVLVVHDRPIWTMATFPPHAKHRLVGRTGQQRAEDPWSRLERARNPALDWAVTTVPRGPAGRETSAWPESYSIAASSANPDAAWAWLKFLTSAEGFAVAGSPTGWVASIPEARRIDLLEVRGAMMPARKSLADHPLLQQDAWLTEHGSSPPLSRRPRL